MRACSLSLLLVALMGCPQTGPPGLIESTEVTIGIALPDILDAIVLSQGFTTGPAVRVELPGGGDLVEVTGANVDLDATLAYVDLQQTSGPETGEIEATLNISGLDDLQTVCEDGSPHGPVAFEYDSTGIVASNPKKVDATDAAIEALNDGGVTLCTDATSPITGTVSVSVVIFGLTIGMNCDEPEPADISGTWTGDYTCLDQCIGEEPYETPGTVTLEIEQDGFFASYTDGEAEYTGIVCGNVFTYVGGAGDPPGTLYAEFGRFTLNSDGTASKESRWRGGWCGGECDDPDLMRID